MGGSYAFFRATVFFYVSRARRGAVGAARSHALFHDSAIFKHRIQSNFESFYSCLTPMRVSSSDETAVVWFAPMHAFLFGSPAEEARTTILDCIHPLHPLTMDLLYIQSLSKFVNLLFIVLIDDLTVLFVLTFFISYWPREEPPSRNCHCTLNRYFGLRIYRWTWTSLYPIFFKIWQSSVRITYRRSTKPFDLF